MSGSHFRGEIDRGEFIYSLFGSKDRVDILAEVADKETEPPQPFSATGIAGEISLRVPTVHSQLKILEKLGLIERLPRYGSYSVLFRRNESPIWGVFTDALVAVNAIFPEE